MTPEQDAIVREIASLPMDDGWFASDIVLMRAIRVQRLRNQIARIDARISMAYRIGAEGDELLRIEERVDALIEKKRPLQEQLGLLLYESYECINQRLPLE